MITVLFKEPLRSNLTGQYWNTKILIWLIDNDIRDSKKLYVAEANDDIIGIKFTREEDATAFALAFDL